MARCINEKGQIKNIPDHLSEMPEYMRRHKLTLDNVDLLEPLKPLEEVNLVVKRVSHEIQEVVEVVDVEEVSNEANSDIDSEIEPTKELSKEDYWSMLDNQGIEYKKTYGIEKLKQLANGN